MPKQEIEQEKDATQMTVIFGQMSLEKPNAGKPVQQIWGFLLLSISYFWIQPQETSLALQYKEYNKEKEISEINSLYNASPGWYGSWTNESLVTSMLPLQSHCVDLHHLYWELICSQELTLALPAQNISLLSKFQTFA